MLKKIALATMLVASLSSASAQNDPFIVHKSFGPYDLAFNPSTTRSLGATPRLGLAITDQRMRMTPAQRVPDSSELLAMTINTVLVDCSSNTLTILVARAYNPQGKQFALRTTPTTFDNPNIAGHSHTETIDFVCQVLAEVVKQNEEEEEQSTKPARRTPL